MWLLYLQLLVWQNRNGLACAVMICPPELPINDEARNEAQVCDGISTKSEAGNYWYIIKSAKSSTLKQDSFEVWLIKSIKGP